MRLRPNGRIIGAEGAQLAAAVAAQYAAGTAIRALAESTGRSYGFIHRLLEEAGAELRHRGGNQRPKTTTVPAGASQ